MHGQKPPTADAAPVGRDTTATAGRILPTGPGGTPDMQARRLSFAQEQLWFLDQLTPGQTTYNSLMVWRLRGPLRVDLLQRCLDLVVARHEVLRVTVHPGEDAPYQLVAPPAEVPLPVTDLRDLPRVEREQRVQAEIDAQRAERYDLAAGPLCRFRLLRLDAEEYVFCLDFHHIITDGWSLSLINTELSAAYRSLLQGSEPVFEERELDYTEFAESQRERLQGDALAEELTFWQEHLAGLPVLDLPADRPRPADGSHHGETLVRHCPDDLYGIVEQLAEDHGATKFMILAAAHGVVLGRHSGLEDFPIGVPMLGRPEPELEAVVGMFINMTVLRVDLSGDPSFSDLVQRVGEASMELFDHQEIPFNQVVDAVQPVREPGRNPLFQVSLQLLGDSTAGQNLALPGVTAEFVPQASLDSRFDVSVNITDTGSSLRTAVEYSTDMFDRWRIEAMLSHVETVLRTAAADSGVRLSQIPVVAGAEAAALLAAGRGEEVAYDRRPLHTAVAEVARRRPDALAVDGDGVALSYGELDRRAAMLARRLRDEGLRHGQVAAVVVDAEPDACVALLAVLKAGGAYALLDPEDPAARLSFMIGDTAAPLVVTRSGLADRLPEPAGWRTVLIDADPPHAGAAGPDEALQERSTPDTLACIRYTSGPDGRSRGVRITHATTAFCCAAYRHTVGLGPDDRLLHLPPLTRDLSQTGLWAGLLTGATLVAPQPGKTGSAEDLTALIRDRRVTVAALPPSLQPLVDTGVCPDLRHLVGGLRPAGGGPDTPGRGLYGPVEAPMACVEDDGPRTPASARTGRPHVNRQLYVVDGAMNLVPRGVTGELLVGGEPDGLADGFLHQPGRTAQTFTDDPFHPGRLVHRTGDLVRWTADLRVEFLGRPDDRIDLGGLRIEPGEVEAALAAHPGVGRAAVLARPDQHGEQRLIGYVTPAGYGAPEPAPKDLGAHLAGTLPAAMIPSDWVVLPEFPLRADGTVDRAALPDPVGAAPRDDGSDAPRTPTERSVADIFGAVLSLPEVGAEESFFDVGGNSLQAMRAVSRINKGFGIKLSVRTLYGNVTVRAVAAVVDEKLGGGPA